MKITMYELLGMVKDGKAPKKVKYGEFMYSYVERNRLFAKYIREPFYAKVPSYLFTDITSMNDIVEILEEEKKIPEEIEYYHQYDECVVKDEFYQDKIGSLVDEIIIDKVNEIINYLNSKGE